MRYTKTEKKPVMIHFTDRELEMLEQLGDTMLIQHRSQVIRTAIYELYQKTFKPYYQKKTLTKVNLPNSDDIVDEATLEGEKICRVLNGKITKDEDGQQMCTYKTYTKGGKSVFDGVNSVPLEELNDWHVENQFKGGSRYEIEETLKKQKELEERGLKDLNIE